MLAQPRKIRLVARQAKAAKRELLAPRLQACDRQYDIGKPTRTGGAIGGATVKLRRFGLVWDSSGPPQVTLRGTFFWR